MNASHEDTLLVAALSVTRAHIKAHPRSTAVQALDVLEQVHAALTAIAPTLTGPVETPARKTAVPAAAEVVEEPVPSREKRAFVLPEKPYVPVRESISEDGQWIICLVDGKRLKMLKRYLRRFDLTPEAYRAHFRLPENYPMSAPGYSLQKRGEALAIGLGTHENKAGANLGRINGDAQHDERVAA